MARLCILFIGLMGCQEIQSDSGGAVSRKTDNQSEAKVMQSLQESLGRCGVSAVAAAEKHLFITMAEETPAVVSSAVDAMKSVEEPLPEITFETASAELSPEFVTALSQIPNLTGISLVNVTPDPEALTKLSTIPELKRLYLQKFEVTDEALAVFSALPALTAVRLVATERADEILIALQTNSAPDEIVLRHCTLDEHLCRAIATHKALRKLICEEVSAENNNGFSGWHSLLRLQVFEVSNWSAVWNCNYSFLSKCRDLEKVSLRTNGILSNTLSSHLEGLPKLKAVHLVDTEINDEGFLRLVNVPSLRSILLDGTQITDEGLQNAHLPEKLEELAVENSPVSCEAATAVRLPESLQRFSINPSLLRNADLTRAGARHRKLLTAGSTDRQEGGVRIWDVTTGQLHSFGAPGLAGSRIRISSDGKQLAAGLGRTSGKRHVVILDSATGAFVRRIRVADSDEIFIAELSPDFERLAVASDTRLQLRKLNGELQETIELSGRPYSLQFSPSGQFLAVTSNVHVQTRLINISDTSHMAAVPGVNPYFSPDSRLVAVSSPGGIFQTIDTTPVRSAGGQFVSDSQYVVCRSGNTGTPCIFEVFDAFDGKSIHQTSLATGTHHEPWAASTQHQMVSKVEGHSIRTFDYTTGKTLSLVDASTWMADPDALILKPEGFVGRNYLVASVLQGIPRHGHDGGRQSR